MDQRTYDLAVRQAEVWRQAKADAAVKAECERARIDAATRAYYEAKARGAKARGAKA